MMVWKKLLQVRVNVVRFMSCSKVEQKIPGPKRYPFLGSLNEMITMGKPDKLHLTIDNYHRKYGSVVHIKLSEIDAVFLSSADSIRSIFSHEGKYPKHIVPPAWLYFNQKHNIERGLLFMDDEEWFKHRQIMNNFLLKDYLWIESLIESCCDGFVLRLKQISNTGESAVEDLDKELYLWSFHSIFSLMLGSPISHQCDAKFEEKARKLVTTFGQIMKYSAKLMSFPTSLADKWNLKIWKDFENAAKNSLELSRELIFTLSNEMEISDNGLLKKMKSANISDEMIVKLFSDLIIAASDTTVYTVLWYLHKVSEDLNLQQRLKNDINENPLNFESPLVRAVLREVLRLYPLATFTGRVLDSEAKVGQYTIPKGWMAVMSLYSCSRDSENFSEPLKFVPDRWLRSNNKTEQKVFKPHGTLPFALGGRSCIGKKVATYQTHCLITKILQQFTLQSLNKEEVCFKSELIGIPDKKILIAFRNSSR